jgi:hypothetical protein
MTARGVMKYFVLTAALFVSQSTAVKTDLSKH